MKAFPLLVFVICVLNLSAQPYQSIFGKNNTMWIIEWENLDFGGIDTIIVEKDTLINNINWKKIITTQPYNWYRALIREDTMSGKVWYRTLEFYSEVEYLAFDFSLMTGDTFDLSANYTLDLIGTVDSVYYLEDIKHIRFDVSVHPNESERVTWIEGVSGNQSPIYKQSGGFLWPYLLCAYKDGVQTYANLKYDGDCEPITEATPVSGVNDIRIFPNPFQSHLVVEYSHAERISYMQLIDQSGRAVYTGEFLNYIQADNFNAGLYFLRLIAKDGKEISRLVLRI